MKKTTFALFLALTLAIGLGVGAIAAANNETISALLSRDITITYNGQAQTFADAQGNRVYPILYNGTTYLPVRAVAGLVNLPVDYNGATNTVVLGTTQKQPTAVTTLKNSGATDRNWVITDKAELSVVGSDATQTYQTGIQFKIWNGSMSTGKNSAMYSEVTGFTSLSFSAWSDIDATVKVFDQDLKVITTFENKAGAIVSKNIDLPAGTTKISFGADSAPGTKGNMKVLDPTVK